MKRLVYLFFVVIIAMSFSGCVNTSADVEVIESEGEKVLEDKVLDEKILIYVSGPEAMINKLEETFEEEHGDVCDMLKMSCGQVRSKVWTELEAGCIQADVVWGSDPLIYNKLDDRGLLKNIELKDIENIKEEFIVADRNYLLVNERYIVIMYNKDEFENVETPKSYSDLIKEAYSDNLVMADATQSSTALGIASALYQMNGDDIGYFKSLYDNGAFLTKSNGQVPSKIMEGQFYLGIGPHDGLVRLKNKAKKEGYEIPVGTIWPSEGAIAIQRPLAVIADESRSEEQEKLTEAFANFLVSKKAQMIIYNFGFASVRKDIENGYIPENEFVAKINWEKASENEDIFRKEYQEIFQQ